MPVAHGARAPYIVEQQADRVLSQANPVSNQLYTVLDTTPNVRVVLADAMITFAAGQPTAMDIYITLDGVVHVHHRDNPVSGAPYVTTVYEDAAENLQTLLDANAYRIRSPFIYEGRSVKVEIRCTWAVNQPTPLWCRLKWARW